MLSFKRICTFSSTILRSPGSNPVYFETRLRIIQSGAGSSSIAKCRTIFRIKLSRLVQSFYKSKSKFLICSALGFHRDGLRSVLCYPPAQELSDDMRAAANNINVGFFHQIFKLFLRLFDVLKILFRPLEMCLLVTPLVLSAPIAIKVKSFQAVWFNLLVDTIEACGPVYVKLGQWASTR